MTPTTCLIDLDGTLTDPKSGITGCIQYALQKLNRPVPRRDELEFAIGPPLYDTFLGLTGADSELAAQGLGHYRDRFGTVGMFENKVYPGIHDCLTMLKEAGLQLFICTSKPHFYAKQIAEHFRFDHFFDHIHGSEMNGDRVDKGELIEYIIKTESIDPAKTVMIGDRKHDIAGAKRCDIQTIGVLYGYGSREELTQAGADRFAETPSDLVPLLLA